MKCIKTLRERNWFTLGTKLALGVAVVSNLCMGALIYINWNENRKIDRQTHDLLMIKDQLSANLRNTISDLQNKYLRISDHFTVDPKADILGWIENQYTIASRKIINGREKYRKLYNRTGRRDLGKGLFVVSVVDGHLIVSHGILDAKGEFTDAVEQIQVDSTAIDSDTSRIKAFIVKASGETDSLASLESKINEMKSMLADEAIMAEKTRNEIVEFVGLIGEQNTRLDQFKSDSSRVTFAMAAVGIILNVAAIFLLTLWIAERPLKNLSAVIGDIQNGKRVDIPYQHRKDQIGMLSKALKAFSGMVEMMRKEGERKQQEEFLIKEIISRISSDIQNEMEEAKVLENASRDLHRSLIVVQEQSASVQQAAARTETNAFTVSESVQSLKGSADDITLRATEQRNLVGTIFSATHESKNNLDKLRSSTEEIHIIVKIVK